VLGVYLFFLPLLACKNTPPSTLVGESEHFRLYKDPDLAFAEGVSAEDVLTGLETNWADAASVIGMPSGIIDYHLMSKEHIGAACDETDASACTYNTTIYTPIDIDIHELNHAYSFLKVRHFPLDLLSEGFAEAFGCFGGKVDILLSDTTPWRSLLLQGRTDIVGGPGRQLARYLMRIGGVEKYLRYYAQAPSTPDAALLDANFAEFWGIGLDQAWTEMHTSDPARQLSSVEPLCPCSLPPPLLDGEEFRADRYRHPYYSLPDLGEGSFAMLSSDLLELSDCQRERTRVGYFSAMVAKVGAGHYLRAGKSTISTGTFVSATCEETQTYDVLPNLPALGVVAIPPTAAPVKLFVQLRVSSPGHIQSGELITACKTCTEFDKPPCTQQPSLTPIAVEGTFYVRLYVVSRPAGNAGGWELVFTP
jgi:hypothetical protein